jgi:hypothetical protein
MATSPPTVAPEDVMEKLLELLVIALPDEFVETNIMLPPAPEDELELMLFPKDS